MYIYINRYIYYTAPLPSFRGHAISTRLPSIAAWLGLGRLEILKVQHSDATWGKLVTHQGPSGPSWIIPHCKVSRGIFENGKKKWICKLDQIGVSLPCL